MSYRNNIVSLEVTRGSNRQKYDGDASLKILAMAEGGMFPEEWCVELGISMRTLYSWANERPEFEEAVEAAWHVLHAYYARLVRQNLLNPSLRQNALLQVMAKRFPSTWGQAPTNTLDHFLARNAPVTTVTASPDSSSHDVQKPMSREEMLERTKVLMDRMADRDSDYFRELGYCRVETPVK
jgi:hypothetical protein